MNEKAYKTLLADFINEIKELDIPVFKETNSWHLSDQLDNGVKIGYKIPSYIERKILHHIGREI